MKTKPELRGVALVTRDYIKDRDKKSRLIAEKLTSSDFFKRAKKIMFYISKGSEVITHDIIKDFLGKKEIFVPVTDKENFKIIVSSLSSFDELHPGTFGVLEPRMAREANPEELDLIIVPGIAFDKKGNRIGYGFGYFDTFLKETKSKKIALAFEEQIIDEIPDDSHDIRVDMIITDKRILKC